MACLLRFFLLCLICCFHVSADQKDETEPGGLSESGRNFFESPGIAVDCRRDFGGALVRGKCYISPVADQEDAQSAVRINGKSAAEWSALNPVWNSSAEVDGWYDAVLTEHERQITARIAVLNQSGIVIHGGTISENETWSSDSLHLVRHWVRISAGCSLTIQDGAVVKFCRGTGIKAEGVLNARNVMFTTSSDDTVRGDTDMNGSEAASDYGTYSIIGNGQMNLVGCRQRYGHQLKFSLAVHPGWNLLALPWGMIDGANEQLLKKWRPMCLFEDQWQRLELPVEAGTVCWIFSDAEGTVDFIYSEEPLNSKSLPVRRAFSYAGLQGEEALKIKRSGFEKVWQWKNNRYEFLLPDDSGFYFLQPGIGYVFY